MSSIASTKPLRSWAPCWRWTGAAFDAALRKGLPRRGWLGTICGFMKCSWARASANHCQGRLFRSPFFCQLQDRGEQSNQDQSRALSLRIKRNSWCVVALASRANDQGRRRVDSVAFQERSLQIVQEMRTLSTENSAEIRDAVEEGERRVARMVSLRRSAST